MELIKPNPQRLSEIFIVTSPDSPEFSRLRSALRHSSVVALDAEWKPIRSRQVADSSDETGSGPSFPTVTLLQIACRLYCEDSDSECSVVGSCPVFLVDLVLLPLSTVWELLREMFVSPSVLKLGFRFKQDLVYLSSTFSSQGCFLGFDEVEPFIDITSIYYYMKYQNSGKKFPKDTISLATICSEILNISLSKVEGLARHLRCVGIDAAVPFLKTPEPRQLLDQAHKEKRVLLTRDAKLMKHQYLANNQVYRLKCLLKNDQLLEVIETFHLNISEEQLMSRCTKCNGSFIQKPLTHEEAIEASKGFQIIPNCLFNKDIEFWQCTLCRQLYWEGNQYHNAVEKFINICKLST